MRDQCNDERLEKPGHADRPPDSLAHCLGDSVSLLPSIAHDEDEIRQFSNLQTHISKRSHTPLTTIQLYLDGRMRTDARQCVMEVHNSNRNRHGCNSWRSYIFYFH
eukprot:GHVU01215348.1.p2 GENE.GHVU01215348.1~~GHVU01215348.1.p2  ORF type:complete len:106 (+),score=7.42 GHVU01215348.1:528-845(+)